MLGLTLATWTGPAEPLRTGISYALVGLLTLLFNQRWRLGYVTLLGLGLLIGASLWGLWTWFGRVTPEWGTLLALEGGSLCLVQPPR